jgi:DeoR/GlpR family transcriptional regulator of sugar metabolism
MTSSPGQRRERILAQLYERRHVTARDLAVDIGVSEATVRRDLKTLADGGQIELVYGGATLRRLGDYSFQAKATRHVGAKQSIGKLASDLVGDQDHIFLDSGTTCFAMAPFLKSKRGLSIIVNSARLALELDGPGLSVILLGGQYRAERMDTVGPLALSILDQLHGYVCFIGADGLSQSIGPAAADIQSASLYHRAVHNARQTVLVVDGSKFLAPSLYKIVDWEAIALVVTDGPPPSPWSEFFLSRGIKVINDQCPITQ